MGLGLGLRVGVRVGVSVGRRVGDRKRDLVGVIVRAGATARVGVRARVIGVCEGSSLGLVARATT